MDDNGDSAKFKHTYYSNKFYIPVVVQVFEVLLYMCSKVVL